MPRWSQTLKERHRYCGENLSGTQTEGAAQKTERKRQTEKDLRRGRATESRGTNVTVRVGLYRASKSDKKISKK
jgi:hypothetical protein